LNKQTEIPTFGWSGFKKYWRFDFLAAISVALVAMPLSLAIAIAAGAPPISGLITAAVAGVVASFLKSSPLTIQGPGAGLIGVIFAAIMALDDGCGPLQAFRYALAAFIVSGALQVIIGLLKYGRIADLFPTTVIQGILASIGIIIFAKQMHVAMGTHSDADNTIGILKDIIFKIPEADPFIVLISGIGILLLLFHARISYKFFHFIPAPVWVLGIAVPIVLAYNYIDTQQIAILGYQFTEPVDYLIEVPDNWMDGVLFPDFSKAHTGTFWLSVISITLLSSVITLAAAKAVDKLDPYKRKTNLNRDLVAVGFSTMVSGAVGGLPVITVIVRSTVNVHNNGKTSWANFYHGLFIALFVLFLTPVIQLFPKAALAAVLIVTGIKLASPRLFKEVYQMGLEQMVFLLSTIIITLYKTPLAGIFWGMCITLVVHLLISRVAIHEFVQLLFRSGTELTKLKDGTYLLKVKGIANFMSMLQLSKYIEKIPDGSSVKVDLSLTRLVDLTFQEKLMEFRRDHRMRGGRVQILGLDRHISTSAHKLSLKSLIATKSEKLTPRNQKLLELAKFKEWSFTKEEQVETSELYDFQFFQSRPLETKENILSGRFTDNNIHWEQSDLVFDEGAMLAKEVYKTTVTIVHTTEPMPEFVLEYENILDKLVDRVFSMTGHTDIDFEEYQKFSGKYRLTGPDEDMIRSFFSDELLSFLQENDLYHIESNGNALLIFQNLRHSKSEEIEEMVVFSEGLTKAILRSN
jgi:MFS superfamily sulfate permease-like transporter